MRQIWRVARREVQGYFDHPTAYVLVVAFLLLALYVAFRVLYGSGSASLRPVFTLLPWLLAIFIPAMTMRSFAEERRTGTLEWLSAQPLTELQLLAGKFLGNLCFAVAALAGTLPTAIGLLLVSKADPGIVVAQYVGAGLLAVQMVATGVWASSATRNQITAFILGVAVSWGLVFTGQDLVLTNLPPTVAAVVGSLSILSHFENVARGVIDLRDVLYFASTAALFSAMAYFMIARLRLSRRRGSYRRLRLGVLVIAAGVIVVNGLAARLRARLDLTSGNVFTLDDATVRVLHGLDDIVAIKLFASAGLPVEVQRTFRDVRDLLADFRDASRGRVRVSELRPDVSSDAQKEAASYGLRPMEFSVLRGDEFQVKRGWFGIALLYADRRKVYPVIQHTEDLEYRLISSIAALTAHRKPRVGFVTGFGLRTPFSYPTWRELLEERYQVTSFNIEGKTPASFSRDSADVLVVAGPRQTIDTAAVEKIRGYLDAGGPALMLVDGTDVNISQIARSLHTGLEPLLERRGVKLAPGLAFDLRSNERTTLGEGKVLPYVVPFPLWLRALPAGKHPMTAGLGSLTLGWASPLEIADTARVHPLWTTSEFGGRWRADDVPVAPGQPLRADTTHLAPQVVAVAVIPPPSSAGGKANGTHGAGRLVVVGDAEFLEDQFAKLNVQNLIFATSALDWLLQDEALIHIRSKDRRPPPLVFQSTLVRDLLTWGNLFGIPLLVALTGGVRVLRRRRQAARRWEGGTP